MIIKTAVKIGGVTYQFEFDERAELETLSKAIVLSNPRGRCNVCGDVGLDNKHLTSNKDKDGNIYVNCKCKCGAKSKLGLYKSGGYFWHEFEVYSGKEQTQTIPDNL